MINILWVSAGHAVAMSSSDEEGLITDGLA